jgi:hypothetical protein
MIYAKVDVKLRDHTRAHRAGAAMATWTWALLYSREQETDGYIQDDMIRLAWVGESEARKHAKKLVEVGLWERDETGPDGGGWRICRYADKNETASSIASRRLEASERMRRVRMNNPRTDTARSLEQPGAVPGSDSDSGSGVDLGSRDRVVSPPANDNGPPAWWAEACATVAATTAPVDEPGARWLEYVATRERKGWATNQRDAVGWLSQVVRRERRDAKVSPMRGPGGGPRGDRQGLGTWKPPVRTGTDDDPFGGDS